MRLQSIHEHEQMLRKVQERVEVRAHGERIPACVASARPHALLAALTLHGDSHLSYLPGPRCAYGKRTQHINDAGE